MPHKLVSMMDSPRRHRLLACVLVCLLAWPLLLAADESTWCTLTDTQGRSIRAQIVSATNDEVVIKREDGQTFTLQLSQLSEADQKMLRAYAKANPPKPALLPAGALELQLSRGKFDTKVTKKTITLVNGKIVKDGLHVIDEKWGYTVVLKSRANRELTDVRLDYVLYSKQDDFGDPKASAQKLKQKRHRTKLEPIPVFGQTTTRTEAISVIKQEYQGGIYRAGTNYDSSTRDTLHGIWLRVYVGDQLVIEEAQPPGLATSEKWPD